MEYKKSQLLQGEWIFSVPNFFLEADQLLMQDSNLYSEEGTTKRKYQNKKSGKKRREEKKTIIPNIFSLIFNLFLEETSAKLHLLGTSKIKSSKSIL